MQGVTHFKLHCNGIKLANRDGLFGKSDPFVLIRNAQGARVGFSEVVMNNLNPFWRPIEVPLSVFGGPNGIVNVQVWDFDDDSKHEIIGEFSTTINELTTHLQKKWELIDPRKKKAGHFVVSNVEKESKPEAGAYNITFAAEKLAKMDGPLGKSDPYLIINVHPKGSSSLGHIVAKSEYIKSNLNPIWKPVYISPNLTSGYETLLVVQVWDYDADGTHDLIGESQTTLRQLIQSGQQLVLKNKHKSQKNTGMFFVRQVATTAPANEQTPLSITLSFKAQRLDNHDLLSKSDPFLQISRHEQKNVIYTSNHIDNNLNPVWPSFDLVVSQCGGMDELIDLQVFDFDVATKNDLIGSTTLTLRHLSLFEKNPAWPLLNPKKKDKMGYKNSGFLVIEKFIPHFGHAQPGYGQPAPGGFPAQQGFPPHQAGGYPPQQHGAFGQQGQFRDVAQPGAYSAVQPGLAPPDQSYAQQPYGSAMPYGSAQPGFPQQRDIQPPAQGGAPGSQYFSAAPQQNFMAPPQNFQPPPGSGSLYNF